GGVALRRRRGQAACPSQPPRRRHRGDTPRCLSRLCSHPSLNRAPSQRSTSRSLNTRSNNRRTSAVARVQRKPPSLEYERPRRCCREPHACQPSDREREATPAEGTEGPLYSHGESKRVEASAEEEDFRTRRLQLDRLLGT